MIKMSPIDNYDDAISTIIEVSKIKPIVYLHIDKNNRYNWSYLSESIEHMTLIATAQNGVVKLITDKEK